MDILLIILIIAIASIIKGITGFGFALVSLPLLLNWYSPLELIPVLVLCNLVASFIIVLQRKEHQLLDKNFKSLIISGGVFTIAGVTTLHYVSEDLLITIMSVFFIVLSLLSLLGVKYALKPSPIIFKIAGALFGFLTGSISVSGPPLALFLNSLGVSNQAFREVFSWFSIVTSVIAIIGFWISGMIKFQTIELTILFLPILFGGSYIGKRINNRVPVKVFETAVLAITLVSSFLLLLH